MRLRLGPQHLCQGLAEFSLFHFHLTRRITGLGVRKDSESGRESTSSSRFQDEKAGHDFHTAPLLGVKYIIAAKVLSFDALLEVLILKVKSPESEGSAEVLVLQPPRLPQFVPAHNLT